MAIATTAGSVDHTWGPGGFAMVWLIHLILNASEIKQ